MFHIKLLTIISISILSLVLSLDFMREKQCTPEYVQYYFVELIEAQPSETVLEQHINAARMGHMMNIRKLASEKKLLLAGPFEDGGGLFILNAESLEEAKKWVDEDPAVKIGLFTYTIRKWVTEKGLLTLEE